MNWRYKSRIPGPHLFGKIKSLALTLVESSHDFLMPLQINTDAEIIIMLYQGFSEKNILSLLSNQLRQIFYDLYRVCILGRDRLGSSTVDETTAILWATLQIHKVMADFSKHAIKRQPSITSIFVRFLIKSKTSEPLKEISRRIETSRC